MASAVFDGNVKRVGSLLRDRADPSAFVKVERHFYPTSAARVLFTESQGSPEAKLQIAAMLWDAGAREVVTVTVHVYLTDSVPAVEPGYYGRRPHNRTALPGEQS